MNSLNCKLIKVSFAEEEKLVFVAKCSAALERVVAFYERHSLFASSSSLHL